MPRNDTGDTITVGPDADGRYIVVEAGAEYDQPAPPRTVQDEPVAPVPAEPAPAPVPAAETAAPVDPAQVAADAAAAAQAAEKAAQEAAALNVIPPTPVAQ